jgi:membrane protease YdiL (CAAX protease family)
MNVTDIAPVRTDQPGFLLALDALFVLVALFCFVRVSTYAVQQARLGTLVNSPRSPKVFPIEPVMGWIFTVCILCLVFLQSPLYNVFVPAGIWVFLAAARRSGEYQFGLAQVGLFHLLRWTLVTCGAVLFLELPLSHVVDRVMNWLQMQHPLQQSVVMFQGLQRPDEILVFVLYASLIVPVIEELFFRGFLYSFLRRYLGVWPAIVLSAGVFAVAHANVGSGLQLWLLGVVLAAAYEHTGSILLPMGIHGCFNFVTAVSLLVDKGSS